MVQLKFNNSVFTISPGNSVLETLLENGENIPNNCRAGVCQTCVMQATKGNLPEIAQRGLKDSDKIQGYFMACACKPDEDIDIRLPNSEKFKIKAIVVCMNYLSFDVIELTLRMSDQFDYFAGQYVTLWRNELIGRRYSLASKPGSENLLTFHIRLINNGEFSGWLRDELRIGEPVFVQGPMGNCFYTQGNKNQNLLLVGTSTGLAPLYGIIHDAIASGHIGDIHLFHGNVDPTGLYMHETLSNLMATQKNFHYHPCVLHGTEHMPSNILTSDINQIIPQTIQQMTGWKSYLCGNPELVLKLQKQLFLAGCNMRDIYTDPFV